jgi:CDP-paratose 2-epimerase
MSGGGRVAITGACGFIGSCLAHRLLDRGHEVIGIDNLCRKGTEINAHELTARAMTLHRVDLGIGAKTLELFQEIGTVDAVFHLAAQVAVTTSYKDRYRDFLDNAAASFHVIEAVTRWSPSAYCLYASTNKVYGHLKTAQPVGADYPLDPYTPYGVSKAVGELYFTEYGRSEIGLQTCSLRQSCIYGHHQFGVEDQGWVAWFAIANLFGLPVTLYGDGSQVRDLLYIDDLIDLYLELWERRFTGVYPIGGGPATAISLNACLDLIPQVTGKPFAGLHHAPTRPGDQPYFVADLSWLEATPLRWRPSTKVREGIEHMVRWIRDHEGAIRDVLAR